MSSSSTASGAADQAGIWRWLTLGPAATLMIAFSALPVLNLFALSFFNVSWSGGRSQWSSAGFAHYAALPRDQLFGAGLWNTTVFAIAAVAGQMLFGFALALLTSRVASARIVYRTVFILPILIPGIVIGAIWKLMYHPEFGLINQLFGLVGLGPFEWLKNPDTALLSVVIVDIWHWTPFCFLLFLAALESLPQDVYEAAEIDGASPLQELLHITLPMMLPTLIVVLAFRIVVAFKVFDEVYLLTSGGPGTATEVVSFTIYQRFFTEDRAGYGAAMSVYGHFRRCAAARAGPVGAPPARGVRMSARRRIGANDWPIHVGLIVAGLVVLIPVAWVLAAGFRTQISLLMGEVRFTPVLSNFEEVLLSKTSVFATNFGNSLIVGAASTALTLAAALPGAWSLHRLRWPRWIVHSFLGWALLFHMIPPITMAGAWFSLFRAIGLDNTLTGIVLAHATLNLPMALWLLGVFVAEVPRELEEAAVVEGASTPTLLLKIVAPLVAPGLAATAVLCFVFSWNEFPVALTLSTKSTATVPVAIAKFAQDFEIQYTQMAASAALSIVPAVAAPARLPALHRQGPDHGRRQMTCSLFPSAAPDDVR